MEPAADIGLLGLLPPEIRNKLYDELEPTITLNPEYPHCKHVHTAATKEPNQKHPLLGLRPDLDCEIQSRYTTPAQYPRYIPHSTIFQLYGTCNLSRLSGPTGDELSEATYRRQQRGMRAFLQAAGNNAQGIQHVRLMLVSEVRDPARTGFTRSLEGLEFLKSIEIAIRPRLHMRKSPVWKEKDVVPVEVREKLGREMEWFFRNDEFWSGVRKEERPCWRVVRRDWCVTCRECECVCVEMEGKKKKFVIPKWTRALEKDGVDARWGIRTRGGVAAYRGNHMRDK